MKKKVVLLLTVGLIATVSQVHGIVVFSDSFDGENGGVPVLNYNSFANWTVSDGTVDLIGNGSFDFYPGNGLYVDLDGSTSNSGKMTSTAIAVTPGAYVLSFELGGNARNSGTDQVTVNVEAGIASQVYALVGSAPLSLYTIPFSVLAATTINLTFENAGGDNVGLILDDVKLERRDAPGVPDGGASGLLLGLGVLSLVGFRVRR